MAVTRIPDGCKQVRIGGSLRLIRVTSPFDWIVTAKLGTQPITVLCDTKSTSKDAFPYSKINRAQVDELHKHAQNGILAGYVIEFRAARTVFFYPTLALLACKGVGSIKPGGIFLGSSQAFDARKIYTPTHHASDAHNPGRTVT